MYLARRQLLEVGNQRGERRGEVADGGQMISRCQEHDSTWCTERLDAVDEVRLGSERESTDGFLAVTLCVESGGPSRRVVAERGLLLDHNDRGPRGEEGGRREPRDSATDNCHIHVHVGTVAMQLPLRDRVCKEVPDDYEDLRR